MIESCVKECNNFTEVHRTCPIYKKLLDKYKVFIKDLIQRDPKFVEVFVICITYILLFN